MVKLVLTELTGVNRFNTTLPVKQSNRFNTTQLFHGPRSLNLSDSLTGGDFCDGFLSAKFLGPPVGLVVRWKTTSGIGQIKAELSNKALDPWIWTTRTTSIQIKYDSPGFQSHHCPSRSTPKNLLTTLGAERAMIELDAESITVPQKECQGILCRCQIITWRLSYQTLPLQGWSEW